MGGGGTPGCWRGRLGCRRGRGVGGGLGVGAALPPPRPRPLLPVPVPGVRSVPRSLPRAARHGGARPLRSRIWCGEPRREPGEDAGTESREPDSWPRLRGAEAARSGESGAGREAAGGRGDGWGDSSEGEDPLPVLQPPPRAAVGSRGRGAAPILGAARPRCSRAGAVGVRLRLAPCPCPAPGAAPRAGGGRGRHWGGGSSGGWRGWGSAAMREQLFSHLSIYTSTMMIAFSDRF